MKFLPALVLWAIVIIIAFFAFMPFAWGIHREALSLTFNACHFPAFFVLSIAMQRVIESRKDAVRKTALLCFLLAALIELIQAGVGREASFYDLLNGVAGTAVGLIGVALWQRRGANRAKLAYVAIVAAVILTLSYPAALTWYALSRQKDLSPLLGAFENEIELVLWVKQGVHEGRATEVALSDEHASQGHRSLRIVTISGAWSGVHMDTGQMDWSNYKYLAIDVFNPSDAFTLHVRIDDKDSTDYFDRYQKHLRIARGWNYLVLAIDEIGQAPSARPLRIDAIQTIYLYTTKNDTPRVYYLDNVRLEL